MNLQSKSKFTKLLDNVMLGGSLVWVSWVFIMYLGYHPQHLKLITDHPYTLLLGLLTLIIGGLSYWTYRKQGKKKKFTLNFRPWMIFTLSLILSCLILVLYRNKVGLNLTATGSAIVSFLANSLFYLSLLLILGLALISLGRIVTSRLLIKNISPLLSLAFGFSIATFISVILGLFGLLHGWLLWLIFAVSIVFQRKHLLDLLGNIIWKKHKWIIKHWWELPMMFIGLVFVSFYWLGGLKAYSVGFDGTALYANLAHLSAQYDYLPGAFQAYGWSVVMGWGERLFQSETMNLLLSHFMYLPALMIGYQIARFWLKPAYALLAVFIPLTMPYMGFHTIVDEKTDLGLLFISFSTVYLFLKWAALDHKTVSFSLKNILSNRFFYPLILLGWLLGFAFSIKYTTLFLIIAIIAGVLYRIANKWLFLAWLFCSLGAIFLSGFYEWGNINIEYQEALVIGSTLLVIGLTGIIYSFFSGWNKYKAVLGSVFIIGLSAFLAFSPWTIKHLGENNYQLSLNNLLYGNSDKPEIDIPNQLLSLRFNQSPSQFSSTKVIKKLTADQSPKDATNWDNLKTRVRETRKERPAIGNTKREELQRYLGYEKGLWRYASIPMDLSFNINVKQFRHQEIGFLFLALLPLLLLNLGGTLRNHIKQLIIILGGIIWISAFLWSLTEANSLAAHLQKTATANESLFNDNGSIIWPFFLSFFEYAQLPFIYLGGLLSGLFEQLSFLSFKIFVPFLLIGLTAIGLLLKPKVLKWPKGLIHLIVFCFAFFFLWLLLGNAISWYALTPLVLLPILLSYYFENPQNVFGEKQLKYSKKLLGGVFIIQIILNIIILFSSPFVNQQSQALFQWPMIEYASRLDLDREGVLKYFSPISESITKEINNHPKAKVYRINSFLQYHIDKNDQRVFEDNQLGGFDLTTRKLQQESDFFKTLKANGFEYIIYALNTPNLDETPEQSLRQKCSKLLSLLQTSPDVTLLLTDHYIEAPQATQPIRLPNKQMAKAQKGIFGKTIYPGTVALFKIN